MERKTGLVLEGGAMRGIFTAGVLDYLLDQDVYFDYVIGVSAGAQNGANFVSRQKGRFKKVLMHENVDSYYGIGQWLESRKIINLETFVEGYATGEIPFDFDTFFNSKTECECVVANCETGLAEYRGNYKDKSEFFKCNMATCAVPFVCAPVEIGKYHYLDGSIIDSLPISRAVEKGCDKIVAVFTKPEGASVTDYTKMKTLINRMYKDYPNFRKAILTRTDAYQEQLEYMDRMKEQGRVFEIRPDDQMVMHFEQNEKKIELCYEYGYDIMHRDFKRMMEFLNE